MKKFRRMMALLLAMTMVLSIALPAMAADTNKITITGGKKGHTYTAYQIFSGDVDTKGTDVETDDELTNIQWGDGVTTAWINGRLAATVAESLTNEASAVALAKELDAKPNTNLATAKGSSGALAEDGNAEITGLPEGYYLVVDTAGEDVADENDVYSAYIVKLVKDVTVASKSSVPTLDKDIIQTTDNSKTGAETNVEADDYNIGDTVTYELTGTLPSTYDSYGWYKYIFHDTISKGLSVDVSKIKVYKDSVSEANDITEKFTITPTTNIDGKADTAAITISNNDLKNETTGVAGLTASSKIIVRYDAVVTTDAVIGSAGNKNEAYLEFSNNPNNGGEGDTSETPHDEVLVFIYELDVTKVDGSNSDLKLRDAQFVLKATSGEHNGKYVKLDANHKISGWLNDKPVKKTAAAADGKFTDAEITAAAAEGVLISNAGGLFDIKGLDAGNYELEEIEAPAGYNKLDSAIDITITATITGTNTTTHDTVTPSLDALKITADDTTKDGVTTSGTVAATVENNSGTTLPETGGIGTTLFYMIGAALVIGAGVLLVTRRRMNVQ